MLIDRHYIKRVVVLIFKLKNYFKIIQKITDFENRQNLKYTFNLKLVW
jgi:hypothetical protein